MADFDWTEECSTFQAAVAKGRAEGRAEALAAEQAEGEIIGTTSALLRRPTRRLGSPPPTSVVDAVRAAVSAGKTDDAEERLDAIAGWDEFAVA